MKGKDFKIETLESTKKDGYYVAGLFDGINLATDLYKDPKNSPKIVPVIIDLVRVEPGSSVLPHYHGFRFEEFYACNGMAILYTKMHGEEEWKERCVKGGGDGFTISPGELHKVYNPSKQEDFILLRVATFNVPEDSHYIE